MSDPLGGRGPLGGIRGTLPPLGGAAPEEAPAGDPLGNLREGGEVRARAVCAVGVCDGSGWIVGDDEVAVPCECRRRKIERARATGVQSAIPKRFRGVSFDRPPVSDMLASPRTRPTAKAVRSYCETITEQLDAGRGLWLMGDVGTGKTSLAMLASKAALDAGRTVAIYSTPALLARIRQTFDSDSAEEGYLAFFNRLSSVDLLHLDDLGAEKSSDWVLEQLYAIVDRRYNDQRSIVFTTNLEEPALREQIGTRTVSRLVEICDGEPLPLFGVDRRVEFTPAPDPGEPS